MKQQLKELWAQVPPIFQFLSFYMALFIIVWIGVKAFNKLFPEEQES